MKEANDEQRIIIKSLQKKDENS